MDGIKFSQQHKNEEEKSRKETQPQNLLMQMSVECEGDAELYTLKTLQTARRHLYWWKINFVWNSCERTTNVIIINNNTFGEFFYKSST